MRILVVAIAIATALAATPATAVQQRSFVASTGSDANPCTITAPCRSLGVAVAATDVAGEVIVQDSAGYGPAQIAQSVSIVSPPGIYAGISVFPVGAGVTVNAPGATVVLRGLTINGQGGNYGVRVIGASSVRIEACEIAGIAGAGIASNAGGSTLLVVDTIVRDNGGPGIIVGADATIVLDRVRSFRNGADGLYLSPLVTIARATVTDSVFAANGADGIHVEAAGIAVVHVAVDRTTLASNDARGFHSIAMSSGRIRASVTHSSIHDNLITGVEAQHLSGNFSTVTLAGNRFANNVAGVHVFGAGAIAHVARNAFAEPQTAIAQALNAVVYTQGNNFGTGAVAGTLTPAAGF